MLHRDARAGIIKRLAERTLFISIFALLDLVAFNSFADEINTQPLIQLAVEKSLNKPIQEYLISEKFDGVRGRWTGEKMITRAGNDIAIPSWFTQNFPSYALDGELWIDRQLFAEVSGLVRTEQANGLRWEKVKFMVFDLPESELTFLQRYQKLLSLSNLSPYLEIVEQFRVDSRLALENTLIQYVAKGAEGLMLHHQDAYYQSGRNSDLIKLKLLYDADAEVIGYIPGKGKYTGLMGALKLRTASGKLFSLGSGFTDKLRRNPPKIGAIVTYQYRGLTKNGLPRFASFYRVRN